MYPCMGFTGDSSRIYKELRHTGCWLGCWKEKQCFQSCMKPLFYHPSSLTSIIINLIRKSKRLVTHIVCKAELATVGGEKYLKLLRSA